MSSVLGLLCCCCSAGGVPTAAFEPSKPTALEGTTVQICPYGTFTQELGSTSLDQCLTPPGFKTVISGDTGTTEPCGEGEYRAEWLPPVAASACTPCGENIYSSPDQQIPVFAITPDAAPSEIEVRATDAACYIKAGQGIYYSASSNVFYARNCDVNSYGAAGELPGLTASPCRPCPEGTVTSLSYPTSAAYYETDTSVSPAAGGFTNPLACVTKPGFGYNGRVATRCQAGSWNPAGALDRCKRCSYGLTTPDDANSQVDASNCTLAPGFGFHDSAVVPCPIGTFNSVLRSDSTTPCDTCPQGYATSSPGATSASSCDTCLPGWGGSASPRGSNCSTQCGGESGATYGPPGRDSSTRQCFSCGAHTGFSFDVFAKNQVYKPDIVARLGASSSADCLSEFGQIQDDAWFLGGSVALTEATAAAGSNMTFDACVQDCKADDSCQYITYRYRTSRCFKKTAGTGSDIIAFKAVLGGLSDGSAESLRVPSSGPADETKAEALSTGSYTFWRDSAAGVGSDVSTTGPTTSVRACLAACDMDGECAAAVMGGVTGPGSVPSSCRLVKGNTAPATFIRSMTKTVVTRLRLEDVL